MFCKTHQVAPDADFGLSQTVVGWGLYRYISAVIGTTRWVFDDGDDPPWPSEDGLIALTWHGRQLLSSAALRRHPLKSVLAASHRDGRLVGLAARRAGFEVIYGSGAHNPRDGLRKGGAVAFRKMLTHLDAHRAIVLTADVPKVARTISVGPIKLAQISGKPIYCFAATTSNRVELDNWDKAHVVLPGGRGAIIWSPAIQVPRDIDEAGIQVLRCRIHRALDVIHQRAEQLVT